MRFPLSAVAGSGFLCCIPGASAFPGCSLYLLSFGAFWGSRCELVRQLGARRRARLLADRLKSLGWLVPFRQLSFRFVLRQEAGPAKGPEGAQKIGYSV